jgi:hypothetical protein
VSCWKIACPSAPCAVRGLAVATGFWAACLAAAVIRGDWRIAALALVGLGLLQAYSFRPLRLNYQGGGELLQAAGCGLVLPALGMLLAGGRLAALGPDEWLGLFLLAMPGALGSTLTDAPADRAGRQGNPRGTFRHLGHGAAGGRLGGHGAGAAGRAAGAAEPWWGWDPCPSWC